MAASFANLAYKYSEKSDMDLRFLQYKLSEDELDPDQLITVKDDTDLQVGSCSCATLLFSSL